MPRSRTPGWPRAAGPTGSAVCRSIQETGWEQKMDGALDRHKVAIIYRVLHHRNWFIF